MSSRAVISWGTRIAHLLDRSFFILHAEGRIPKSGRRGFICRILSFMLLTSLLLAGTTQAGTKKPERFVTENGMTVAFLERKALPFITIHVTVRGGSAFDPEELAGLANITADLLTEGTSSRTASQISEEIDYIGGSLSSYGGIDYASASVKVLSKDSDTGFELLSDILIHPSFPPEEIERMRSRINAGIISKKDEPSTFATEEFNEILFGRHPYSRPAEGTLESLDRIKRDDIAAFHRTFYRPNNTIMAVVGDIDEKELKSLLHRHFGTWKRGKVEFPLYESAEPPGKRVIKVIDRDITQANIFIGHLGISRDNPDFYAAHVMNYILGGGGFVSRLMTEIRDNRGLVYSVSSYFNPLKDPGPFKIGIQTRNETAREAITEALNQVRKMISEGISEKELRDAKDYLTGSFPLKFTTNDKIGNYLTYIEVYNLGLDYLDRFPGIIEGLTIRDINGAAKKYLDPENYILVVVGNKEKIGEIE